MKDRLKKGDLVVVILHDHGSRYVGKLFNDDWMRERGFLDKTRCTAMDIIEHHKYDKLITIDIHDEIASAIEQMGNYDISQLPVTDNEVFAGSINDSHLFSKLLKNPELRSHPVQEIMQKPFPFVEGNDSIEAVSSKIGRDNSAVLVKDADGKVHIITKQDIIQTIK